MRGTEPAQDMSYCRSFRLHGSHTRQLELDHTDQGYISALQDLHHELYTAVLIVVVGRDHTDNEGIPNDNTLRATYGVYPAGGAFDDGLGLGAASTNNLGGAGIVPIMLSSFTNFMLAESAITLGTSGNARDFLSAGLMDSFNKKAG